MPIAILPEMVLALARTATVLSPWNRLIALETQLLRRAQSAFIVRWFGTSVPEDRLSLSIAIVNIDALKARFHQAQDSVVAGPSGPSLLGPLAGLAGLLSAMVLSIPGAIVTWENAEDLFAFLKGDSWRSDLLTVLYRLFGFWIIPPLLVLVGAGGGWYAGLSLGVGNEPSRMAVLLLAELAALFAAANVLWGQLKGPRSEVRNPLLAKVLTFADSLARGYAHTLGFVALVVTTIGRLLPGLIAQLRALGTLLGSAFAVLVEATSGIRELLVATYGGKDGLVPTLKKAFKRIGTLPGVVIGLVQTLLDTLVLNLVAGRSQVSVTVKAWVAGVEVALAKIFTESTIGALVARIKELQKLLPDVVQAFKNLPKAAKEPEPHWLVRALGQVGDKAISALAYAVTLGLTSDIDNLIESGKRIQLPGLPDTALPAFPDLPKLPDVDALAKKLRRPEAIDTEAVARQAQASADALRASLGVPAVLRKRPHSAFADERVRLDEEGDPSLRGERWLLGEKELRDLIYLAVGRALPSALRPLTATVKERFDQLDQDVYDEKPAALDQPMLTLEDNGRLRPVVARLVIRTDGLAADAQGFRDLLVAELEARPYLASVG